MPDLTQSDLSILALEEAHPKHTGPKEETMRVRLGMTGARYYQRLDLLLADPAIIAAYPQLANRRMRQRDARWQRREAISRLRSTP